MALYAGTMNQIMYGIDYCRMFDAAFSRSSRRGESLPPEYVMIGLASQEYAAARRQYEPHNRIGWPVDWAIRSLINGEEWDLFFLRTSEYAPSDHMIRVAEWVADKFWVRNAQRLDVEPWQVFLYYIKDLPWSRNYVPLRSADLPGGIESGWVTEIEELAPARSFAHNDDYYRELDNSRYRGARYRRESRQPFTAEERTRYSISERETTG